MAQKGLCASRFRTIASVRSKKLYAYVNGAIGLVLVLLLAVGYWFFYRPLPQTSGSVQLKVSGAGRIERDSLGIPHIFASSEEDVWALQGYAAAQDRMFQMELLRRYAAGELAEILGPGELPDDERFANMPELGTLVGSDRINRILGLRRIVENQVGQLTADERRAFAAYSRGVNAYLTENRNRLPVEFQALRFSPKPWRIEDCMLVGLNLYVSLTNSYRGDLNKQMMLSRAANEEQRKKVEFLWPVRSGKDVQPGSNAWAISGNRTSSGKPLLANDTHLEMRMPATWHMVHLKAGPVDVIGFSLPGLPGIQIGRNAKIAWGATNLGFDVQDLYAEQMTPDRKFVKKGAEIVPVQQVTEWIGVKDFKPVRVQFEMTSHGPVVDQDPLPLSLKWSAAQLGGFRYSFLAINRAQNWAEFRSALADFVGPAQNFIYADQVGNIGLQVAGRLPIRSGFCGDHILDGSSGQREWQGYIPFEELPNYFNPKSGVIVTANQDSFPAQYTHQVCGGFASAERYDQIKSRLAAKSKLSADDMVSIQMDVYAGLLQKMAKHVAKSANTDGSEKLQEAAQILKEWDGQMDLRAAAPVLAVHIHDLLRDRIADVAVAGGANLFRNRSAEPVGRLLDERPSGWVKNWNEFLTEILAQALKNAERGQGDSPNYWAWGLESQVSLANPVLDKIDRFGWFSRRINVGPLPMSGGKWSVKQVDGVKIAPSMRFVTDFGGQTLGNITVGQSGHLLSRHYRDHWNAYYYGKPFSIGLTGWQTESTLEIKPE
jgi:penicillin G amidase